MTLFICSVQMLSPSEELLNSAINVRLAGSGMRPEGRLEVQYNGTWGTVTDDYFSSSDAKVFCYIMGFGSVLVHYFAQLFKSKRL